jgi:hypothetical protein
VALAGAPLQSGLSQLWRHRRQHDVAGERQEPAFDQLQRRVGPYWWHLRSWGDLDVEWTGGVVGREGHEMYGELRGGSSRR